MTTIAKPVTKIVELTLNGFHGYQSHNVRATFTRREAGYEGEEAGYDVTITESASRKFACKSGDCRCGEGMPTEFICDDYDFDAADITVEGNYPQR